MTLQNLRQDYIWGNDYLSERDYFVQIVENNQLYNGGTNNRIHGVGGNPTLGYGFDLSQRGAAEIAAFLPSALGGNLTADQENAMELISLYKAGTLVTITGSSQDRALEPTDIIAGSNNSTAQVTFNDGGQQTTVALSSLASIVLTHAQATTLLHYTFDFNAGPAFTGKNANEYAEQIVGTLVAEGRERAALTTLAYNGGSGLVGPSLRAAINAGNRAEAWYEIRYNSNNGDPTLRQGLAKRYLATAALFSLYDSDGPTLIEAKQIFAMFAKHAVNAGDNASNETIGEYDTLFAARIATANTDFVFPAGDDEVKSRREEFRDALDVIFDAYGITDQNFREHAEVLVDPNRDNSGTVTVSDVIGISGGTPYLIVGEGGADVIQGGSGNDVIFGDYGAAEDLNEALEGNDVLDGGGGSDTIHGGGGADIISGGDGDDIISAGTGLDSLYGGAGGDTFAFEFGDSFATWQLVPGEEYEIVETADTIYDADSTDRIVIGGIELSGGTTLARSEGYYWDSGVYILWETLFTTVDGQGLSSTDAWTYGEPYEYSEDFAYYTDGYGFVYYVTANGDLAINADYVDTAGQHTNTVLVKNWSQGDLGIYVSAAGYEIYGRPDQTEPLPPPPPMQAGNDILASFHLAAGLVSPLVLDLNGDGVESVALSASHAFFDLDGNDFAEHTGWVGADDAFLAMDRDGSGYIENINELFGNSTTNGFSALALLDSNNDGIIDKNDEAFSKLRLWIDADQDGTNDVGELKSLGQAGVTSISLAASAVGTTVNGNLISDASSFTKANGGTGEIVDIWFANDRVNTKYVGDVGTRDVVTYASFDLRGYGEITGLRQAMWSDASLDAEADALTSSFTMANLSGWLSGAVDLLYNWGNVDNISMASRGSNIDARHLEYLEKVLAQDFSGTNGANPTLTESRLLEHSWSVYSTLNAGYLLSKVTDLNMVYDVANGDFQPVYADIVVDQFGDLSAASADQKDLAWILGIKLVDSAQLEEGYDRLTLEADFQTAISQSGLTATVAELRATELHIGSSTADYLLGSDSQDYFLGGSGVDTMVGGAGNDIYEVDDLADVIVDGAGQGIDTIKTNLTFTLGAEMENLTLTGAGSINGTGNAGANVLTGNLSGNTLNGAAGSDALFGAAGNDTLNGGDDNDVLNGGLGNDLLNGGLGVDTLNGDAGDDTLDGGAGSDIIAGGTGNDYYYVESVGDQVTEASNAGTDTVQASLDWTLASNFENLVLFGAGAIIGTGNAGNNVLTGNSLANTLNGLDGNDTLNGADGNDTLAGGNGNDVLNGGTGIDALNGGAGNDVLDGGTGGDSLTGAAGNDSYYVDNVGDVLTESSGQGTDTVFSAISWGLATNFENLTLLGSSNIDATGNSVVNTLIGNTGDNVIDGGSGADKMSGGLGNDFYYVDNASEQVTELSGEGADTIQASLNWTLGSNVENLILSGAAAVNGTGNVLDNTVTGNSLNNLLSGGDGNDTLNGADGNDTLTGGLGDDVLNGGTGHDVLDGGAGNDLLSGATGNDTFTGGAGDDFMTGNAGADRFDYNAITDRGTGGDVISDFVKGAGGDVLDLTDLLDSVGYVGSTPFDGADGYLRFTASGSDTVVELDQDGGSNNYVTLVTLTNVALMSSDTQNYTI